MTLTHALETQAQLSASLSNPGTAMQELAGEILPAHMHALLCPQEGLGMGVGGSFKAKHNSQLWFRWVVETGQWGGAV